MSYQNKRVITGELTHRGQEQINKGELPSPGGKAA